jgi:hypothetical protein
LSIGYSAIDDDGAPATMLNMKEGWNYAPLHLSVSKPINSLWNVSLGTSFSKYDAQTRNGDHNLEHGNMWMIDLNTRYTVYFANIGSLKTEMCTYQGLGLTSRSVGPYPSAVTVNTGLGMNFWIRENFGLNTNAQAKWSTVDMFNGASYMQYSISAFYVLK